MRFSFVFWLSVFVLNTAIKADVTPLPSFGEPALSPDRLEIAFVSGGDIWTVPAKGGEAHLLISHPATESRPLYSPDGARLAFTSTRTGNGDIYALTFATGEVKRLTYSDSNDLLDGWSRDGKWLYFSSSVNDINQAQDIFRVSVNSGTPLEVTRDRFYNEFRGAPSPDGTQLAFVARGMSSTQWWRHGHSHLDESEIWLKDIADKGPYKCLVAEDAKQGWPMWSADGKDLFYTSDRTGVENVFRQPVHGGPAKQVSHLRDGRLLWPSISYDGREIVFERGFKIWKLDTNSGSASEISITLRGAASTPAITHQTFTEFTDLALSHDGKKIAVIAHGEVFAASATDGGDALRITRTPAPESDVQWAPDSNRLVYVSSRNGHHQVFEYDLTQNAERQLTNSNQDDEAPTFSPDGKQLAFVRDRHQLHMIALQSKEDNLLSSGDLRDPALAWSPDGTLIAFTSNGAKSFRNVSVMESSGGVAKPVSFLANGQTASRIAWSPDGKYLLFNTAQRGEQSKMARVDLQPHLPRFREDQFRELFRNKEPAPEQRPLIRQPDKALSKPTDLETLAKRDAPPPSMGGKSSKRPESICITFEGIRERLTFVPLGFDVGEPVISPDGKTLVFAAATDNQWNLYSYSLDELATEPPVARQLTSTPSTKSDYQFSADSKTIYFLDNGHVNSMPIETRTSRAIAVTAALDIDFDVDKMATFEQGWATLNRQFYDPKFHGQDWARLHDLYAPFIAGSRTPDEMRRVMNLMIGELNASHSGLNPAIGPLAQLSAFSPMPMPIGRLGLRFEREPYEAGRGLIIREIIPLSPAALEGSIKIGETLLAVDEEAVGPQTNLDNLLQSKVNRRVVLRIGAAGHSAQTREAVVRSDSASTEKGLLYRAWVEANRAYVERISHGKLGYVHIADMSEQSLNQLYIDLDVQNQTKQGVVIDIRDNNGGFVNQYVIDVFTRKNYLTMTPRGGNPAPARPALGQRALGLPTVLVTNQGSLSDAEDFTEGYRALELGKVVGEPTAGWIIYTGATQLLDGSTIRIPFIRVQGADGTDMEMQPRPVDIRVERMAGDGLQGKDVQLQRAVTELLRQVSHS
ncbi:MAG: S41 family peptidase [Bryobacteraceae bacterium]